MPNRHLSASASAVCSTAQERRPPRLAARGTVVGGRKRTADDTKHSEHSDRRLQRTRNTHATRLGPRSILLVAPMIPCAYGEGSCVLSERLEGCFDHPLITPDDARDRAVPLSHRPRAISSCGVAEQPSRASLLVAVRFARCCDASAPSCATTLRCAQWSARTASRSA